MPPKRPGREALLRWLPLLAILPVLPWLWGAALLHPLTLLPVSARGDMIARFLPLRRFSFGAWRAGRMPLWDPLILGGVPNLGGVESALLYPPNWLHLLLPDAAALNLLLALHLWLAAALATLLARRLGAGPAGAALAGLCWALGGTVLPDLRAGHLTVLCALAWAPLVYAAFDGWLETRRPRWLAAAAAAFALQLLAGNPQTAYYTALGALVFAALRLPKDGRARLAAGCGAALLLGALIAAAQLLPAAAAARESPRMGAGYAFSASFSLPPENLLTLLAPYWLGGGAGDYFGRLYHWEACLFCGAAALLLACACPAPRRRPLLGGALVLLVLALGSLTPLHRLAYLVLPGFGLFRGPAKFSAQALLLLCAAAGLGYEALREAPARRRLYPAALGLGLLSALGCAAVALAPGAWARLFAAMTGASESFVPAAARTDPEFARYAAATAGSGLGLAAAALLAAAAALRWAPRRALWALAALELLLFAGGQRDLAPAGQPAPPELTRALAAGGEGRFMTRWTAHPNLGLVLGRPEVWGYDQLLTRRWAELAAWTQGSPVRGAGLYQPMDRLTPRTALLGARWLYLDEPSPRVEEARPAPPRAFVARARPVAAGGALEALSAPGFDLRREAAVESAAAPAPASGFAGGSASVRTVSADALEVEAEAPGGGVVVVADAFAAGWSARALPGSAQQRYEVVPADHALRGVPVGPGRHRFLLVYEPPGWRPGLALSALGLLALAALAFVG
jgi:hypothetical protein